jgi:hypothetical protein
MSGSSKEKQKINHKNLKSYKISCFEVLDVLFRGLVASPLRQNEAEQLPAFPLS